MELVENAETRLKVIKKGTGIGRTKYVSYGLFLCPSCESIVELPKYKGLNANSCGAIGCKSKASTKYGHRAKPLAEHIKSNPNYTLFNGFFNRNIKNNESVSDTWQDFKVFFNDMFDTYNSIKLAGSKAVTLYITNKDKIDSSNSYWVDAASLKVTDFTADKIAGVWHTKMLAFELGMQHYDLVKSMNRLDSTFGEVVESVTTEPGLISKPTTAFILSNEQYDRLKHRILDLRQGKVCHKFIYLMKCGSSIKIGITNNVASRLSSLVGANAGSIELLYSTEVFNANNIEKELHTKYAEFNTHHEWFNLTEDQVQDIITYLDSVK